MQAVSENLYRRGARGTYYLRRRIPGELRDAYPHGKQEITVSLRTRDLNLAKERLHEQLAKVKEQFAQRRAKLRLRWKSSDQALQVLTVMSQEQAQELASSYVHFVLETDEERRRQGLPEDEFEELGASLAEQRRVLGGLLARGDSRPVIPAMRGFMHLRNIQTELAPDEEKRAAYTFLQGVVTALDHQLGRQEGKVLPTAAIATAPSPVVTWENVFNTWRDYVDERPKATSIACNTAWKQLERVARSVNVLWPAHVTPMTMNELVEAMRAEKLSPKTINERLRKIKAVYTIAVGKGKLQDNPATATLGVKLPNHKKGVEKRQPFAQTELQALFGSPVYTQHLRSRGQSGESTYWLPIIMFYTGARPEEVAGLVVDDVNHADGVGWYLDITDLPSADDSSLFDGEAAPAATAARDSAAKNEERRHLKNIASRRLVPIAPELIELGLLRYVEYVKGQHEDRLFPTLTADTHGKLSGAHGKFFGRYKREIGIVSPFKTLYSLRHNMKDMLEEAQVPSRYLKRILGHATGDGAITDGYGTGLPLPLVAEYFAKVRFPKIPALPWEPGRGFVYMSKKAARS
jgi:integrase